jgi:hypothetical protein
VLSEKDIYSTSSILYLKLIEEDGFIIATSNTLGLQSTPTTLVSAG